jgi:hypothetical protein
MENLVGPRLLQAFFEYATDEAIDSMDNQSKRALRVSCKNAKVFVDGTVTTAAGGDSTLDTILRCDWHLSKLLIEEACRNILEDDIFPENEFTSLFHSLCSKFPTLQVLEINIPPYPYDLPANIGQLSKLRDLKIVRRYSTALPASFGQLSSLERLELDEFYEPDVDSSQVTIECLAPLKQLTQLKYLKLGRCLVRQPFFPAWLDSCHFPVLEDLILAEGWLLNLPSSIGNFSNLTSLYIEQTSASEVPESIGSLILLKKFCIWEAGVSLPTSFSKLTTLEELDVTTDMQSFALIEHFRKLTRLEFFRMREELIGPYPEFLWTFTSLRILNLWGSAVPSLPDALGNLRNLEFLYLQSHRNLAELPESLGDLTCLTSFKIEHCPKLLKLPESIGNLKDLRELRIYQCRQVKTLPESIGNLKNLEKLIIIDFEKCERLPSSIGNLHALKELLVDCIGEVFLPESFADLVLDKPIEECFLKRVSFIGSTKVVNGPRVDLAFRVLRERGALRMRQ